MHLSVSSHSSFCSSDDHLLCNGKRNRKCQPGVSDNGNKCKKRNGRRAGDIVNTLYIIVITLVIATPIGVGSAIYLNEYAKPGKIVRIIEFTTETLSGIPSIIFGLFGSVFFGTTLKLGYSL